MLVVEREKSFGLGENVVTDQEKFEQVANAAAEEGDPDVVSLAEAAIEGDEGAAQEALFFWNLWNERGRFTVELGS